LNLNKCKQINQALVKYRDKKFERREKIANSKSINKKTQKELNKKHFLNCIELLFINVS